MKLQEYLKEEEIVCPKCGSKNTHDISGPMNHKQCVDCGHLWTTTKEATEPSSSSSSSDKTEMVCRECGKEFKKKIGAGTYEVKCPKCGSYDTDVK